MAIHLKNKALASMDDKNNTKVVCYLDGGDVCGFVGSGGVGSGGGVIGSGGGGRVYLLK